MAQKKNAKIVMLPHSQAKVDLYIHYLSVYLNVIERVDFMKKIYVFDLFSGEGIYEDGNKGSSIQSIEAIKRHYYLNGEKTKDIELILNDSGISKIEINKRKIDRIKELSQTCFIPQNVKVRYFSVDYNFIIHGVIRFLKNIRNDSRALVFIDPWGYKEIHPEEIKLLMQNGKTEVLLFLPVYFMYRFANKAITQGFEGGESLELFLKELFSDNIPNTKNVYEFITDIKIRFQEYLQLKYVDTFSIERDRTSVFCLFFFTNNKIGYQKMIHTKWDIDKEHGKGFELNNTGHLFPEHEATGFDQKLEKYILEGEGRTNNEIKEYCYDNGFLPKHANLILKEIEYRGLLSIEALDTLDVKGFYIDNEKRKLLFKIKNK